MKYRMTIDVEAESLPEMAMWGPAAAQYAATYSNRGEIISFRIDDVTPTEGEIIPAEQCECIKDAKPTSWQEEH